MVIWMEFYCYIISLVNKLFRIFISVFLFVQFSFQLFSSILAYLGQKRDRERDCNLWIFTGIGFHYFCNCIVINGIVVFFFARVLYSDRERSEVHVGMHENKAY